MVPKMAIIRGNWGLDVRFYVRDPEKAHPWAEPRVLVYFASKSVQGLSPWRVARTKKPKKLLTNTFWCATSRMRENDPPWQNVTNFCTDVGAPRRNHLCRFVLRSLTGFGRGGWSNFGFLHWLASSPLQHSRRLALLCECVINRHSLFCSLAFILMRRWTLFCNVFFKFHGAVC